MEFESHPSLHPLSWFRRRSGITVACLGRLWDYQDGRPGNAEQFLANHRDGRYGGSAIARWDGANLWAPEMRKAKQDQCYELLEPMLVNFPAVPPGYDGWWTFSPADDSAAREHR